MRSLWQDLPKASEASVPSAGACGRSGRRRQSAQEEDSTSIGVEGGQCLEARHEEQGLRLRQLRREVRPIPGSGGAPEGSAPEAVHLPRLREGLPARERTAGAPAAGARGGLAHLPARLVRPGLLAGLEPAHARARCASWPAALRVRPLRADLCLQARAQAAPSADPPEPRAVLGPGRAEVLCTAARHLLRAHSTRLAALTERPFPSY
mmetsp:Transcript_169123/g.411138  ORF Transcript_169123/g.411138 Transcript_169123/m.411138 type:complete len:208 (-) Transcript_169123:20-643(-)